MDNVLNLNILKLNINGNDRGRPSNTKLSNCSASNQGRIQAEMADLDINNKKTLIPVTPTDH